MKKINHLGSKMLPLLSAFALHAAEPALYKVVDLSAGPDAETYPVRDSNDPPDIENDACRTTELWLRYAPPGTFTMGSPESEVGRFINEEAHEVTLTQGFYIGVFEVTQKQYELITGLNPSQHKGDTRPVETVSYQHIRGSNRIAQWPANDTVEEGTILHRLRARTGLHFDLPLEAQWEYACRAGTSTAFSNGKELLETAEEAADAMAAIGRHRFNADDGRGGFAEHTRVGSYDPNPWGLFDMHGNVAEWCKDSYDSYSWNHAPRTDPVGAGHGAFRVARGGTWGSFPRICRSANREYMPSVVAAPRYGFRLVHNPVPPVIEKIEKPGLQD